MSPHERTDPTREEILEELLRLDQLIEELMEEAGQATPGELRRSEPKAINTDGASKQREIEHWLTPEDSPGSQQDLQRCSREGTD